MRAPHSPVQPRDDHLSLLVDQKYCRNHGENRLQLHEPHVRHTIPLLSSILRDAKEDTRSRALARSGCLARCPGQWGWPLQTRGSATVTSPNGTATPDPLHSARSHETQSLACHARAPRARHLSAKLRRGQTRRTLRAGARDVRCLLMLVCAIAPLGAGRTIGTSTGAWLRKAKNTVTRSSVLSTSRVALTMKSAWWGAAARCRRLRQKTVRCNR